MLKTVNKMGIEEMYFSIIKEKANIILKEERFKTSPQRSKVRQGCPLLQLLWNTALDVLARAVR